MNDDTRPDQLIDLIRKAVAETAQRDASAAA